MAWKNNALFLEILVITMTVQDRECRGAATGKWYCHYSGRNEGCRDVILSVYVGVSQKYKGYSQEKGNF